MFPALQAARHLRRIVTTLLAIVGTTISLFFGHSLDGTLSADSRGNAATSMLNSMPVAEREATDPALEASDSDLCSAPEAAQGAVVPRAFFRQHCALTVLSYAPRIRWSGLTGCPESPPRPVTLTSLCISQT